MTQDGEGNLLEKRYRLDNGTFSKNGDFYQIDTAVADSSVDYDVFLEIWRANNPNRALRTVITIEYETDFAFIILHHQKN